MRNNKGFVLMETIIVMSVLSVALMTLYSSYVKIMANSKAKNFYDTPEALYIAEAVSRAQLYNKGYLASNIEDNSDKKATIIKNGSAYKITCYNAIETYNKKATCSTTSNLMAYQSSGLKRMYDAFNIEAIYVVDALEFKNLSEDKFKSVLQFFDGSTIGYLKSIDRSTIDPKNDTYTDLIIVKIKTEEGYVFGRSERTGHN
ncbi:prepilin-type N-terminal cleavage/methylation domain-containing protein [bacterium]|nr:prepilin-type N-terminal cleavage/methylation domain-containing protein [bacterium]MDY3757677.1 prepilin-type N-terminal cleavage/methylation domain-containing protein [Bacilli bacterium]